MGRNQVSNHASTSSEPIASATPPLFRLPTDVWLHIFVHLSPSTLSSLSLACRHILRLVDAHAFKHVFSSQYPLILVDRVEKNYRQWAHGRKRRRSKWWFACRHAEELQRCWDEVVVHPGSMETPVVEQKKGVAGRGGARGRRLGMDFAIPTLALGTRNVVVGVRSELVVYRAQKMKLEGRVRLNGRLQGEPPDTEKAGERADDPWLDITALQAMDGEGSRFVVGFANGTVQVLALKEGEKGKGKAKLGVEVEHNIPKSRRQEIVGLSVYLPTLPSTSLLGEPTTLASLSKRGNLRLHHLFQSAAEVETQSWQIDSEGLATPHSPSDSSPEEAVESGTNTPRTIYRSAAFNNAPFQLDGSGGSDTRAWSVLLGSSSDFRHGLGKERGKGGGWVAVGITADPAVYIYPIHSSQDGGEGENKIELGEPFYVASTGQRTSVYAMTTPPMGSVIPAFLLFVGFYDGVIRVYDTRQIYTDTDEETKSADMDDLNEALGQLTLNGTPRRRKIRRELNPMAVFREDFDADAIYSLSFGGPRGTMLVVGGARHAKVRVFDASALAEYDVPLLSAPVGVEGKEESRARKRGDWTAFAIPSTDSPVYAVQAEAGKVVGVIDRRVWWFDFSHPSISSAVAEGEEGEGEEGEGGEGRVAYFRHRDGVLSYSTWHFVH